MPFKVGRRVGGQLRVVESLIQGAAGECWCYKACYVRP